MSGEVLAGASRLGSWGVKVGARLCAVTDVVKRAVRGDDSTPCLRHVNAQVAAELLALVRSAGRALERACFDGAKLCSLVRDMPEVGAVVAAMQRHCDMYLVSEKVTVVMLLEALEEVAEHINYAVGEPVRCGF
jgi:hypothetical protein